MSIIDPFYPFSNPLYPVSPPHLTHLNITGPKVGARASCLTPSTPYVTLSTPHLTHLNITGPKVGAQVLTRALRRVRARVHHRDEVVCGVGRDAHDDAALLLPPAAPAYLVHTIDYFRSFVSDPYLFGQIAANHALSDVHAMNGDPVSALALAVLPYGPEEMVEDTLVQVRPNCI